STVMDAANKVGTYIPHFCYHKKLSIAANCRMCLVEVEKAPKPLPACATPVTAGMKVKTHSDLAVKAQKGVMEFLLINHPLDCPICDQGGECQLQDLAVGYGQSGSRFAEEKRVVLNKNLGSLISTDMTRCIHCTRCVRFGQEIAGVMELGVANRGEHSEIMPFISKTVDSELSGNMIDLCPVGALTSKPFRFSARTWELSRRKSVSPHDSLGANLIVQVKHDEVKRVLPLENEDVNECWISDKDRFSYEALNSEDRLTRPMIKQGGQWREVEWQTAIEYAAHALKHVSTEHGADALAALASPHSTLEELYLAQKLLRGLGSDNIDHRLRQSDFRADGKRAGAPWLGTSISDFAQLDRVLIVGSFLRKDHPLLAQRLRQSAKRGTQVSVIHPTTDELLINTHTRIKASPTQLIAATAEVLKALAEIKGASVDASVAALMGVPVSPEARRIAQSLASGERAGVFLGNLATAHPEASTLALLAQEIARIAGAVCGTLGEAANSVGAYLAGAVPKQSGNAANLIAASRKAYLLLNAELEDFAEPQATRAALAAAETVIALTPFKNAALDYADVILPIAPFTETSGTFVNTEGRAQSFHAVCKPLGETRPGWKVLRVLANLLALPGFDFDSTEAVKAEVLGTGEIASRLNNRTEGLTASVPAAPAGIERIADVPIYFADPLARRAPSLQKAADAKAPTLRIPGPLAAQLGLQEGASARVKSGAGEVCLQVEIDDAVASGCARIAGAHASTAALGALFGNLTLERA
ncbi:MAG: hypothetical protein RIR70_1220, partial [Pseudomonadota bacterium]